MRVSLTRTREFGLVIRAGFGGPAAELDAAQCALLVALVRGPSWYDPWRHPERALERRKLADSDEEGSEIGWAVQVAATGEWLAVSRRQLGAVREALGAGSH